MGHAFDLGLFGQDGPHKSLLEPYVGLQVLYTLLDGVAVYTHR